jgi:hypothetical protein
MPAFHPKTLAINSALVLGARRLILAGKHAKIIAGTGRTFRLQRCRDGSPQTSGAAWFFHSSITESHTPVICGITENVGSLRAFLSLALLRHSEAQE